MIDTKKFISKYSAVFTLEDHYDFHCALKEYFQEKAPGIDSYNFANYLTKEGLIYLFDSYADFGKYCADPFIHQEVDQEMDWYSYGKRMAETDPRSAFIILEHNSKIFAWQMREDLLKYSLNNLEQTW